MPLTWWKTALSAVLWCTVFAACIAGGVAVMLRTFSSPPQALQRVHTAGTPYDRLGLGHELSILPFEDECQPLLVPGCIPHAVGSVPKADRFDDRFGPYDHHPADTALVIPKKPKPVIEPDPSRRKLRRLRNRRR